MPIEMLRPDLIEASGNLMEDQGALWRNPATTGDIDVLNLRVYLPQAVHGVQAEAAITDFSIATGWQEQQQDRDARVELGAGQMWPATGFLDFPFTIDHGGGTMSPRAFRARTYLEVDAVVYYSRWKYWFAGKQAVQLTNTFVSLDTVNHVETRDVSSTDGEIYAQYIQTNGQPFDGWVGSSATLQMKQVFNIGEPVVGWATPYRLLVRNREDFTFSDDERSYEFTLISRVATDAESLPTYLPHTPPNYLQTPQAFPIGDEEFPELEAGPPCSTVLTIYDDDKTTPLYSFGDYPDHPRPYLETPEGYGEQVIDVATGSAEIGQATFRLIDPPTTPGDQDSGYVTGILARFNYGDIVGRRGRWVRFISPELGFVVIADGPISSPTMTDFAGFSGQIRDVRETERKVRLFDSIGGGVPATSANVTDPADPHPGFPPVLPIPTPGDDGKIPVANPDGTYDLIDIDDLLSGGYPDGPLPDPDYFKHWYDARFPGALNDGDPSTTLPNQGYAGSAENLVNTGGTDRPVYHDADPEDGLPYFSLDGTDDYWGVAGLAAETVGERTIFLVSRGGVWANNAGLFALAKGGVTDNGNPGTMVYQQLTGSGQILRRNTVNRSASNAVAAGAALYDDQFTWQAVAMIYRTLVVGGVTRAVLTMIQGGRVVSFDEGGSSLAAFTHTAIFLGARNASGDGSTPDNFWAGDIRHFSMDPSAMPIVQVRDCLRRLCQDHGVPVMD